MSSSPTRVTHLITGLDTGGAERLLLGLLGQLGPEAVQSRVISLTTAGTLGPAIESLGVQPVTLGINRNPSPADVRRIRNAIRGGAPDLVQTWLLHSNTLGAIAARLAGRVPVVWGIHVAAAAREAFGIRAAALQRLEALASWSLPAAIISCSDASTEVMHRLRYASEKIVTIPNGIDTARFRPDPDARRAVRAELGLADTDFVVGHVARFHRVKDHQTLLEAAARVAEREPRARFVLCGSQVTEANPEMRRWAAPLGDRVRLLGERTDVERIYAACDAAVSSSTGEAMALSIGEAMACALPVAATAVGDAAALVGRAGRLAPARDPRALAAAILELASLDDRARLGLGEIARAQIGEGYSIGRMAEAYLGVWQRSVAACRAASR